MKALNAGKVQRGKQQEIRWVPKKVQKEEREMKGDVGMACQKYAQTRKDM